MANKKLALKAWGSSNFGRGKVPQRERNQNKEKALPSIAKPKTSRVNLLLLEDSTYGSSDRIGSAEELPALSNRIMP